MDARNWCKSGSTSIHLGSSSYCGSSKLRWKMVWMKLKKKLFESSSSSSRALKNVPCYDPLSYSQNFEIALDQEPHDDNLSRSFSARFAHLSTLLRTLFNKAGHVITNYYHSKIYDLNLVVVPLVLLVHLVMRDLEGG
ncbi:5-methyltetrahydropteroyltriglutamate--homocysteine methyltransferase [Senna tora]|uniref:5-methyltetrahydropteroyltriglutamate--homocysteine methyltransferase n=1 Tax=Senna tora TaxID=362788 RepID=A0A834WGC2_9FABA|nr:5-methyltetrahydropteroyltriglutamate--homocysteine methyltransferase [Senna tora]